MPVETKEQDAATAGIDPIECERNGVKIPHVAHAKKRGDKSIYFAPPNNVDKQQFLTFIGVDKLFKLAFSKYKLMSQTWTKEATNDDGSFDRSDFKTTAEALSAKGETIAELQDSIDELLEEFTSLDLDVPENLPRAMELRDEIKTLKSARDKKKRTKEEAVTA